MEARRRALSNVGGVHWHTTDDADYAIEIGSGRVSAFVRAKALHGGPLRAGALSALAAARHLMAARPTTSGRTTFCSVPAALKRSIVEELRTTAVDVHGPFRIWTRATTPPGVMAGRDPVLPAEYSLSTLDLADADMCDARWKYRSAQSLAMIRECITDRYCVCIRHHSEPVSWALRRNDGSIGLLHTELAHRRKGLAAAVVAAMTGTHTSTHQSDGVNVPPYFYIAAGNIGSERVCSGVGFAPIPEEEFFWIHCTPNAVQSRRTSTPVPPARYAMYALLSGAYGLNILQRTAIKFLSSSIIADPTISCVSASSSSMLLGAFFPAYCLTQVPASFLARIVGEHAVTSMNLFGIASLFLLVPVAASAGGDHVLASVFLAMGALQGPIVPMMNGQRIWWMPLGSERAWASRLLGLGGVLCESTASALTPALSSMLGWRTTAMVYGGFTAAFAALWWGVAAGRPAEWRAWRLSDEEKALLEAARPGGENENESGGDESGGEKKSPEEKEESAGSRLSAWELCSLPATRALFVAQIATNTFSNTFGLLGLDYFVNALGATPSEAGRLLSLPPLVARACIFAVGFAEHALEARGRAHARTIRLWSSTLAFAGSALSLIHLALSSGAASARSSSASSSRSRRHAIAIVCIGFACSSLHSAGFSQSYLEVGAEDAGLLSALGNSIANLSGFLLPMLLKWFRQRRRRSGGDDGGRGDGSFRSLFLFSAALQLVGAGFYASSITTKSAQRLLKEARRKGFIFSRRRREVREKKGV